MFKNLIEKDLQKALNQLGFEVGDTFLSIPENPQFGDYTTNIPLQLAKQKSNSHYQSSSEIANALLKKIGHPSYLERIDIAGPGFINFYIKDDSLVKLLSEKFNRGNENQRYLVEYAHPNTLKEFHIGHLRNISIGESISRILEFQGNEVFRVTYGSDIGPNVAKALWGILNLKDGFEAAKKGSLGQKIHFLGKAYVKGAQGYEGNKKIKKEIDQINQKLYQKDPELIPLWEETKVWSIAYLDSIYLKVGTEFDAQIWESEVEVSGKQIVMNNLNKVFVEDKGAVIFPGEKYGLHNRVFITSAGYPTYEGKELGLTQKEEELFTFDTSLHIVASEQAGFFQVVIKALEMIEAEREGKKKHISYGMVNLSSGKMSSRKGEIITAEELIGKVKQAILKNFPNSQVKQNQQVVEDIAIGAIKFSFLKYSLVSDISFDIDKSISLQGDSGPYVQYTYARTKSLLSYAKELKSTSENRKKSHLEEEERAILRQLDYLEAIVEKAAYELSPNTLTNYLLDLAKLFNLFYQRYPVVGSKEQEFRLSLTKKVGQALKIGLHLLGIEAPERM